MHDYLIDMLECPACRGELAWRIDDRRGSRVETAEARCEACGNVYPTQEGIGVFLTSDLPREDLWEQQNSWLIEHLREHPEVERRLMDPPLETLGPADQLFRRMVLEERGQFEEARAASESAKPIYTEEYRSASASQRDYVVDRLSASDGPIVDLASGAGGLVEEMARKLDRPLVATDFSPTILRRDRAKWERDGVHDRVSLLALDARQMPFKDGAVETMTSNYGLPNILAPGPLMTELRRVVSGVLLAISHFYDEEDEANAEAIREMQLEFLLYRCATMAAFAAAGWEVDVANSCSARATPTPCSEILDAGIDGMPVAETVLEFCVLAARGSGGRG